VKLQDFLREGRLALPGEHTRSRVHQRFRHR
jgi:hypothetical protein